MPKNTLDPIIKLCQKNEGTKSEFLRQITAKGLRSNWATVSSWLHPDPAQRRTPRESRMKILLAVQRQMVAKAKKNK